MANGTLSPVSANASSTATVTGSPSLSCISKQTHVPMPTMCNNPYKRSVQTSDLNAAESLLFLTASITPKKRSIVSVGTPSSIIPKRRSHTSLLPSPTTNIVHAGPTYVDRTNITFSTPTPTINNKMAPVSHSPFSRGTTPFSFVTTAPCLRRMINDFKSSRW
eukprot:CAMPEP_0198282716 /NCGR_PEP_ID=MMETSP1449-20131203/2490_1 /TAXON_ID=420275 /ORGANISM="Attheya septentrionalis, Strain CCMP2084" /LENGTH=162 /DNA_ID=CAMNT_0043979089 /DNA_START=49 /DNA_END=534 /DNA_ORIENTATION=-